MVGFPSVHHQRVPLSVLCNAEAVHCAHMRPQACHLSLADADAPIHRSTTHCDRKTGLQSFRFDSVRFKLEVEHVFYLLEGASLHPIFLFYIHFRHTMFISGNSSKKFTSRSIFPKVTVLLQYRKVLPHF